jgi:hypothetical protein
MIATARAWLALRILTMVNATIAAIRVVKVIANFFMR